MSRTEARRLFYAATTAIANLDARLFAAEEASELGLIEADQRAAVPAALDAAIDTVSALANLQPMTAALVPEVQQASVAARQDPFATVTLQIDDDDEGLREEYEHPLTLRRLAGRLAASYGIDADEADHGLTAPQAQLRRICKNVGNAVAHLVKKKVIDIPSGEHVVKHVLFACVSAAFPDAVPDGGVSFPSRLRAHVPDLAVPRLRTCVEIKVTRTQGDLSTVIDGLIGDIGNYGSTDYDTFLAMIYTSDPELTDELLKQVVEQRYANLGANPIHHWNWSLVRGLLAPSGQRKVRVRKGDE